MFGQNNSADKNDAAIPQQSIDGVLNDQASPADTPAPDVTSNAPDPIVATPSGSTWQHPGSPITDTAAAVTAPINDVVVPTGDGNVVNSAPSAPAAPSYRPDASPDALAAESDLIEIKQKALSQLSPLVDHLDQTPEDKFRTTMMLIQASDNQALIKDAFAAAQAITDEKSRAQALLDIVNEINYFTQQSDQHDQ